MVKLGDVYQRTEYNRNNDVPSYFVVVIGINKYNIMCRRENIMGHRTHENIKWSIKEFSEHFKEVKND